MPKIPGYSRDNSNDSLGFLDLHLSWLEQPLLYTSDVLFNSLTTTGDITVNGNFYVNGGATVISTNLVELQDNIILINSEQTGNTGVTLNLAGIEVERGDLPNFQSVYEESSTLYKIGNIGNLQAVATREDLPLNKGIFVYNQTLRRIDSTTTIELPITFSANSTSTSSGTGTVVITGGLGVSGDIFVDNSIKIKGSNYTSYIQSDVLNNLIVNSGANFIFQQAASSTISVPTNVFLTFSVPTKRIYSDGTDLFIQNPGGNISFNTVASGSLKLPVNTYLEWDSTDKIRYNGTNVTFESSGNFVFNNKIVNTDATASSSASLASVMLSGGLSISNITNSNSSTNGGTITTNGGVGILKKLYVGEALIVSDQSITTTQILGQGVNFRSLSRNVTTTSTNDLSMSSFEGGAVITSATIPNATTVYITGPPSVSGGGAITNTHSLLVGTGTVKINSTLTSVSASTGGLLLLGGFGINNTTNSTSSTNGGTFTTAGGAGISKKLYIGESLTVSDQAITTVQSQGQGINFRSLNRNVITSSTNDLTMNSFEGGTITTGATINSASTVYISGPPAVSGAGTLSNRYSLLVSSGTTRFDAPIIGNDTTASTSPTTGALTLLGGIGISNTTDSSSENSGGTFTTAGGAAIKKKLFVGTSLTSNAGSDNEYYRFFNVSQKRFTMSLATTEAGTNSGSDLIISRFNDAQTIIENALEIIRSSGNIKINSVTASTSSTTGSVILKGSVCTNNTTDATSATNGGTITTAGGVGIAKKLFVGTDLGVTGISNLRKTNINTDDGVFQVTGSSGFNFLVANTSYLTTTTGSLVLDAQAASLTMTGNSGVTIDSGSGISIDGTGASNYSTSSGAMTISGVGLNLNSNTGLASISSGAGVTVTSSVGDINVVSTSGNISLQSDNTITIGNATSTVVIGDNMTVNGDLIVLGDMTTINSTIVTIADNAIVVNSSPSGTSDGGLLVKRYQTANNTGLGEVVADTPKETGSFQSGSATPATLILGTGANAIDGHYNGWWIKVTSGPGNNQVRRIKSYTGTSKQAVLYATGETDGLNLITAPVSGNTYNLYNKYFASMYFNELAMETRFAYASENQNSGVFSSTIDYMNIHVNDLTLEGNIVTNGGVVSSGAVVIDYTGTQALKVTKSGSSGNIFNVDSTNSIFTFTNPVNTISSNVLFNLEQYDTVNATQIYSQFKSTVLNNVAGNLQTRLDLKIQKDTQGLVNYISLVGGQQITPGSSYVEFGTNAEKVKILSTLTNSLELQGGISIANTTNATSSTVGGTITTAGGAAIAKDVYIGGNLLVSGNLGGGITTNLTLSVTNQVNITSITYSHSTLISNGLHRQLEVTFRINITSSSEYVSFDLTIPEVSANFADTFSVNSKIQGFYSDIDPTSLENIFGYTISGTKNLKIKLTGGESAEIHTVHILVNYTI